MDFNKELAAREAAIRQLHNALTIADEIIGGRYEGREQWDQLDTIAAALNQCQPEQFDGEIEGAAELGVGGSSEFKYHNPDCQCSVCVYGAEGRRPSEY